ncbi:deoxynucleoside kinase [Heliomicrobium gestii]|uniref:deoxynucleoside kinase n=1 Tax=Heliomicrobium gestii TaxID=2699 RepID=UPI00195DF37F|nr:deoxynucleoside kinase [Heliomicrobium gestii]MBM7866176.1 deoxyadenosine/deoxycytidine kinase [Heliomicrobium gestii]
MAEAKVQLVIDGVTGVGKSSLVDILSERLKLVAFSEMFEDENQLLHKFFHNRERWAFPMQINFLTNRFKQYREASRTNRAIMDRSIYSDAIFARMYREQGYLTVEEYSVYENLLNSMLEGLTPPRLMVYLKADTDEAIRRIQRRGRSDELTVEREYWAMLNLFYENNYRGYQGGQLLTIDVGALDFVHNPDDREAVLDKIITAYEGAC